MVKRQKERQYETAREHRANSHLRSGTADGSLSTVQRRLPFSHCALTLTKYETPVCFNNIVFENSAIIPFLLKHKIDPVSGSPANSSDLIQLNMDKNDEGAWQCPILTKPFSDNNKIVAIIQPGRKTANVYSFEAYHELILKTKTFEDLLTSNPFNKRTDVVVLFDPDDEQLNEKRDINSFYHVTHKRKLESSRDTSQDVKHSLTATRIMEKIKKKATEKATNCARFKNERDIGIETEKKHKSVLAYYDDNQVQLPVLAQDVTGVQYTKEKGGMAASLTSTGVTVSSKNSVRHATDEEILQAICRVMRKRKTKGYVKCRTNLGTLTLELHCDMVPKTCVNFLGLCQAGKYNNTKFHRLVPKFMIQGGKPVDGDNEECFWGGEFSDEFDDRLKHAEAGILSMANAGTDTNKRQFFVTFQQCAHLDRKHSVFGCVVGGLEELLKWETLPCDKKNVPREDIRIIGTDVLVNPYQEARDIEYARLSKICGLRTGNGTGENVQKKSTRADPLVVGRYLKIAEKGEGAKLLHTGNDIGRGNVISRLPPPPKKTKFGDFSGW